MRDEGAHAPANGRDVVKRGRRREGAPGSGGAETEIKPAPPFLSIFRVPKLIQRLGPFIQRLGP